VVDASVVVTARQHRAAVLSSDRADLRILDGDIAVIDCSIRINAPTDRQEQRTERRGGRGWKGRAEPHPDCMLICMHSTSVRIDAATHEELKRLAAELNTTVGNTVSLAVRALRQERVGADLTAPLQADEVAWLDADLG